MRIRSSRPLSWLVVTRTMPVQHSIRVMSERVPWLVRSYEARRYLLLSLILLGCEGSHAHPTIFVMNPTLNLAGGVPLRLCFLQRWRTRGLMQRRASFSSSLVSTEIQAC